MDNKKIEEHYYDDCFAKHQRRGVEKCVALNKKYCEIEPQKVCSFYCSKKERRKKDLKYGKYQKRD